MQRAEAEHPISYLMLAKWLWESGKKDDAVLWYYIGQVRARAYVAGHPKLDPTGEPAAIGAIFATMGPPINQYAFGDIAGLAATIDRALAWDESHPDNFTPKSPERDKVVNGLRTMKVEILATADDIRKSRAAKGLENRTR